MARLVGLQMLSLSDWPITKYFVQISNCICPKFGLQIIVHMESIEKKGGKEVARLVGLQMLSLSDWPIEAFSPRADPALLVSSRPTHRYHTHTQPGRSLLGL